MSDTSKIQSITSGPRQSNIELLRIISMFLVLMVHANFWSLGTPDRQELTSFPMATGFRIFLNTFCSICVNVFILISGKFGIRRSFKGLCSFLFQCIYFVIAGYILMWLVTGNCSIINFINDVLFLEKGSSWFIKAYLGLYILSPVLNSFADNCSKQVFKTTLILFFSFQTYFGMINGSAAFIQFGYSVFSFIGLYLLGRYYTRFSVTPPHCILLYISTLSISTIISIIGIGLSRPYLMDWMTYYISPTIILMSFLSLVIFDKIHIKPNKLINWVSASCFGVYLLHMCNAPCKIFFKKTMCFLYESFSGCAYIIHTFTILIAIFIIAILIDQPRKFIWTHLIKRVV